MVTILSKGVMSIYVWLVSNPLREVKTMSHMQKINQMGILKKFKNDRQ